MGLWKEFAANLKALFGRTSKCSNPECGKPLVKGQTLTFENSDAKYCGVECYLDSTLEVPREIDTRE